MSEVTEMKKLSDELKGTFETFKEKTVAIDEAVKNNSTDLHGLKAAQEETNEKMNGIEDAIQKFDKRQKAEKARTEMADQFNKDEVTRKQCYEFIKGLRQIAIASKSGSNSPLFRTDQMKSYVEYKELQQKRYSEDSDENGGIFVIPTLDAMLDKLIREFSPIRSVAGVRTFSSDTWRRILKKQNNGAKRKKDISDFNLATKQDQFGEVIIKVEDLFAIALFDDNLIMDASFDLISDLLESIAEDFAITEASEFLTGGAGEMRGLLTYPDSAGNEFDKIQQFETSTSTKIIAEDLMNMQVLTKNVYTSRGAWYMNRLTMNVVRKLRSDSGAGAGTGEFLWQPGLQAGMPSTLLGNPVTEIFEMPGAPSAASVFTAGVLPIAFGSLRDAYMIVDRMGMEVTRDPLTQYPDVAYKVKKRSGGGVVKGEAVKLMKIKA